MILGNLKISAGCRAGHFSKQKHPKKKTLFWSGCFREFFSRFPDSSKPSQPDFYATIIFDTDFPGWARISNSQGHPGRPVLRFQETSKSCTFRNKLWILRNRSGSPLSYNQKSRPGNRNCFKKIEISVGQLICNSQVLPFKTYEVIVLLLLAFEYLSAHPSNITMIPALA